MKAKQNKNEQKVIYYTDELNDEFSSAQIVPRKIDETYKYGDGSLWWHIKHRFWLCLYAPCAALYLRFKWHHKIVNRKCLKKISRKQPFFMFANHTNPVADAFIPTFVVRPKNTFVIVHPNNVSMPVIGKINPYVGAIPLPDNMPATKNFMNTIKLRVQENAVIHIYPEAHIWPFYTGIRPFADTSFRYPIQYNTPVFCFTNTYQKRRFFKTPKLVTYVDGPFFADPNLPAKEQRSQLRDAVYNTMCERSKNSNVDLIKYLKKE